MISWGLRFDEEQKKSFLALKEDDTADTSNDTKIPKDLGGLNDNNNLITNPESD
jgi:hypothetical protein